MAMSKGKIFASAAGGLFVVAAGVLGYLLYDTYSTRMETEQELEDELASFRRFNQAPVFPSRKSIDEVLSNKLEFASWFKFANGFAAKGDRTFPKDETPASFKQRLAEEVRRLAALPGGVDGHLTAPGFLFGFEKYLGESAVLPDSADVPRLAVQLDTIALFTDIFASAGVLEIKEIKRLEKAVSGEQAEGDRRGRASAKRPRVSKGKEEEVSDPVSLDYQLSVALRPSAFVSVLNALTANPRFIVVTKFAFRQSADVIVDKLNAAEAALAKKDAPVSSSRRRRRRAAEEEAPAEESVKKEDRLVVDPELDAPIQVDMTVTVYDFGQANVSAADGSAATGAPSTDKEAK